MLSHMTAAWWRGLIEYAPPAISVRTPRRCRSLPGITVHGRSDTQRHWHKPLPVTSLEQMLDLVASAELQLVRKALGRLDYRYELDTAALARICGRGRTGRVHGVQVDAHYVEQRLVVELDGGGNHHSPAQMRRDHRNDLVLRGHGLRVNRYSRDLVHDEPLAVRADVLAALDARS
jgi:hypothetical protein